MNGPNRAKNLRRAQRAAPLREESAMPSHDGELLASLAGDGIS